MISLNGSSKCRAKQKFPQHMLLSNCSSSKTQVLQTGFMCAAQAIKEMRECYPKALHSAAEQPISDTRAPRRNRSVYWQAKDEFRLEE